MANITIIDYGMGNLRSVAKAFEHTAPRHSVVVTQSPERIRRADRVVFPGQGAIGDCMRCLDALNMLDAVREAAATKPFLGLCLGPQALMDFSDENGGVDCLGVLPGRVLRLPRSHQPNGQRLKIPHMGWNRVQHCRAHPLWEGIADGARFYFVHSYYLVPAHSELMVGRTEYGIEFASAVAKDNVFAVQFHPEKSAQAGLGLLTNFANWDPDSSVTGMR